MQQRLYEITLLLIQKGQASAKELSERFEVSIRTIYRDIDALSLAGLPVYSQRGRGGGIRLMPGYVLDKALFSAQERTEVLSQLQSLAALGTPLTEGVLEKLSALFGQADSWLEVDFAPWGGGEEDRRLFALLREAILRHETVCFAYSGADGRLSERKAEPHRILFRGQGWYLHAFCQARQDFRFFKLTRISGCVATGESFLPRPLPQAVPPSPVSQAETLVLRFSSHLAFRVYDEFPRSSIQKREDGSLEVALPLTQDSWLLGYLLSFGRGVQVLAPSHLRQRLREEILGMAEDMEQGEVKS